MPAYTPPGGTIKFESQKNAQGRYPAVGSGGGDNPSGGTSALGWEAIDGDLEHGSRIKITTDGTKDFGSKVTQNPVLWDMGQDVRIGGTSYSEHANASDGDDVHNLGLFDASSTDDAYMAVDESQRHQNINRHYIGDTPNSDVDLSYNNVIDETSPSRIFYAAHRFRMPFNYAHSYGATHYSLSGTFDTGVEGELGESVTITANGTDYSGNIIDVDNPENGVAWVYSPNIAIGSDEGVVTVVGVTSGASMDLDFSNDTTGLRRFPPSAKLVRIGQGEDPAVLAVVQIANNSFWIESNDIDHNDSVDMGRGTSMQVDNVSTDGEWILTELFVDWSDPTDLRAYWRMTGDLGSDEVSITGIDGSANYSDDPVKNIKIGIDSPTSHPGFSEFGEVFLDYTPQRIAIADADVWGQHSNAEIFYTQSWSSTEIEAEIYAGGFSNLSGKYLYWFDVNNQPELVGAL